MKKLLVFLCFVFITTLQYGQKNYEELSTEFFTKYEYNTDMAFDYIFGTNKWMEGDVAGTATVKQQINNISTQLGEYIGYEKISEKYLGKDMVYVVYIVKYERQPLRFLFQYYKPKDTWMLFSVKYDENLQEELKTN